MDAATDIKITGHFHGPGSDRFFQVVQDSVCDCLVEGTFVPEGPEIKFQRFQLHAEPVRNIMNSDRREIGLPGPRA